MSKDPFKLADPWTIWKYVIPLSEEGGLHGDCFKVMMPKGAQVLSVGAQIDTPVMWVMVKKDAPGEERHFLLCGTGQPLMKHPKLLHFIGTTMIHQKRFVLHVFEVK